MRRSRCVDAHKAAGFPAAACDAAGVSTSAWYAWAWKRTQGPSHRQQEETRLLTEIRSIHARSGGTDGSPRVGAELRRRGPNANHQRVERLLATHGIVGYRPRRRRSLTKQDAAQAPAPDLLGGCSTPTGPTSPGAGT